MREAVRHSRPSGHVHGYALGIALSDKLAQVPFGAKDIKDRFPSCLITSQNGSFDAVATAVSESKVARAACRGRWSVKPNTHAQIQSQGIGISELYHVDPHVYIVISHGLGQYDIELFPTDQL
jgi:hypothetical protein